MSRSLRIVFNSYWLGGREGIEDRVEEVDGRGRLQWQQRSLILEVMVRRVECRFITLFLLLYTS